MSIEEQKKLRWIPAVQLITVFFLLKTIRNHSASSIHIFKVLLLCALPMLIMVVLQEIAIPLLGQGEIRYILNSVTSYLFFLAVALIAVREQEEIIRKNTSKSM